MPKKKKATRKLTRVKAKAAPKRSAPKRSALKAPKAPKKKPPAKKAARAEPAKLDGRAAAAVALAIEAERRLATQAAAPVTAPSAWLLSARPRRTHTR